MTIENNFCVINAIFFYRFFSSGSMQRHIASNYRVSKSSFCNIIDVVCNAICTEMQSEMPKLSKADWLKIADEFNTKWNYPNCLGSIDGKHVAIKRPKNAGSLFFNYKVHSLPLQQILLIDAKFLYLFPVEIPQHRFDGRCRSGL